MGYFLYQSDFNHCALASLRMFFVNRTGNRRYCYLRIEGSAPYSLLSLEETAKRYGFSLTFFKTNPSLGLDYPDNHKQDFLLLLKEETFLHMVYVRKIKRGFIYYYDPASGKKKEKIDVFAQKWSGVYGVLTRDKKMKAPPKISLISRLEDFFLYCFPLLANISLLLGFYFFYEGGNVLLPIISFLAFAFLSILSRLTGFHITKKLDALSKELFVMEPPQKRKERYKDYCAYKVHTLSYKTDAFSSFFAALALTVLFSLNNLYFLLPLSVSLILRILFSSFFKKGIKKANQDIEQEENVFLKSEDEKETGKAFESTEKLANTFYLRKEYVKIIDVMVLLSSSLLCLIGTSEVTLNFYLFHLFSLFSVLALFKPAMDLWLNREDYRLIEDRYLDYLNLSR